MNLSGIVTLLTQKGVNDLDEWPISDLLHLLKDARSRELLGTVAFNRRMDDLVHAMSLTKNIPEDHRQIFEACKSID
jgi:hypothetical protein